MKYTFIYILLVLISNCLANESISYLENKARSGDVDAQVELAMIYEEGVKVPKDDGKAFEWWSKAAEMNVDIAQYNVGLMYDQGKSVPQNKHMAY
jgi:TPR repeat protein